MESPDIVREFNNENVDFLLNLKKKIEKNMKEFMNKREEESNLKILKCLDDYIYDLISYFIYEITTNKYPKGKKYNMISIKIIYMKEHLEGENFFNNENKTLKKLKKDLKKYIDLNGKDKWKEILKNMEYILPEKRLKEFKEIDFDKNNLKKLHVNSNLNIVDSYSLVTGLIDKITYFFIEYVKVTEEIA